jgi:large subunit ribosomal protein L10
MPLKKTDKEQLVSDYSEGLAAAPHAFLLSYQGITVPQVTTLRDKVRQSGGYYEVVKNTLALRAIDGKPLGSLKEHFVGPTAVVYSSKDPVALAKALTDFAKDVPAIQFKAGLVEKQTIPAAQIKDIAGLPSREELITKLVFLLQSPIVRFVRVLAAVPKSFVVVLDQIAKQKGESAPAEAAASVDAAATPEAVPAAPAAETPAS